MSLVGEKRTGISAIDNSEFSCFCSKVLILPFALFYCGTPWVFHETIY